MGSVSHFTTDTSEQLHILNVAEAYRYTYNVYHIERILKHNYQCAGLDYIKETLSYLTCPV